MGTIFPLNGNRPDTYTFQLSLFRSARRRRQACTLTVGAFIDLATFPVRGTHKFARKLRGLKDIRHRGARNPTQTRTYRENVTQ